VKVSAHCLLSLSTCHEFTARTRRCHSTRLTAGIGSSLKPLYGLFKPINRSGTCGSLVVLHMHTAVRQAPNLGRITAPSRRHTMFEGDHCGNISVTRFLQLSFVRLRRFKVLSPRVFCLCLANPALNPPVVSIFVPHNDEASRYRPGACPPTAAAHLVCTQGASIKAPQSPADLEQRLSCRNHTRLRINHHFFLCARAHATSQHVPHL